MSVCLSVCLSFMHLKTVRPNSTKLSKNLLGIEGKVTIYFFNQKINPNPNPSPKHGIAPLFSMHLKTIHTNATQPFMNILDI